MGTRRTRPLVTLVLALAGVLVLRLYQIQVLEHGIWADEARRLELSGAVLPYDRGAILDADGRALVEDAPGYVLELDYREFRRGHPLGQVAHARSTLLARPVPLQEALAALDRWASELVTLSPGELYDFARGAGLARGGFRVDATERPAQEQRSQRAADLRYYVAGLLEVDDDEKRELRRLERRRETRASYLELVADARGLEPGALLAERRAAWAASVERLRLLAARLARGEVVADGAPFESLVGDLEGWRRSVEDAAATALFREVFGFLPGRVAPDLLLGRFDLEPLRRLLRWDGGRLAEWAEQARFDFLDGWREGYALPRLLARVRIDGRRPDAERLASTLLAVYAPEDGLAEAIDGRAPNWRAVERLAVLDELEDALRLEGEPPAREGAPLVPLDEGVRQGAPRPLTHAALVGWIDPVGARRLEDDLRAELGSRYDNTYDGRLDRVLQFDAHRTQAQRAERTRRICTALLDSFEVTFQAALRRRVEQLVALSPAGRLEPSEERTDRLAERARHLEKDYSSRPVALHERPDYELVFLLTRDGEHYPGLRVVPSRERRAVPRGPEAEPLARDLVGRVALLDAGGEVRQREKARRLAELRRDPTRTEDEELELAALMQELLRRDELRGVSGLEASFDPYLRGANGYREQLGLEDVYGRGAREATLTEVEDGESLRLTLDGDLQRATRRVVNEPTPVWSDPDLDRAWFGAPVGAAILVDLDGRVLAAASAPDAAADLTGDEDGERARVVDRVFGRPNGFQPIGSVYKPFVALWALDRVEGFDASFVNDCAVPPGERWAEYEGLRCHNRWGHGPLTLPRALAVSCNPYFARLADVIGFEGVVTVAHDFGLTEPSGVLDLGPGFDVQPGFVDWGGRTFEFDPVASRDLQLRRAANGLQVVEASPAQVARAYLALVRGERVPLRLVDAVGDRPVPPTEPAPLPYARASLDEVRGYLLAVTNSRDGSAADVLSQVEVGYPVVAKTGSADLSSRPEDDGRVRKHTWVAGWLPADDPQLVFVVYVHDTTATSGHSAGYLARELLLTDEVGTWLAERGHARDHAPGWVELAPVRLRDGGGR